MSLDYYGFTIETFTAMLFPRLSTAIQTQHYCSSPQTKHRVYSPRERQLEIALSVFLLSGTVVIKSLPHINHSERMAIEAR